MHLKAKYFVVHPQLFLCLRYPGQCNTKEASLVFYPKTLIKVPLNFGRQPQEDGKEIPW